MNDWSKWQMFIFIHVLFSFSFNFSKWKKLFDNFAPHVHVLVSKVRLLFSEDLNGRIPTPAQPV